MVNIRPSVAVVSLFACVLALSGCGNGDTHSSNETPEAATIVYAVPTVSDGADTAYGTTTGLRTSNYVQASTLFTYSLDGIGNNGCDGVPSVNDIVGDLAESWEFDEDKSAWIITLRDAKSAAGNTLSADDVKWSLQRAEAINPVAKFFMHGQAQYADDPVEILNPTQIALHVNRRTALDLGIMTSGVIQISDSVEIKSHATADDPWGVEWMKTHTANYGPWQLESIEPSVKLTYVANENYYGERGNISKFIITAVDDPSTRTQLIQSGDVQATMGLTFAEYQQLEGSDSVVVNSCIGPDRDDIVLNGAQAPFNDPRVRQAFSLAVDRQALVDGPYMGYAKAATFSLSSAIAKPSTDELLHTDVKEAQKLLAEAGYPDGFTATLTVSPTRPGSYAPELGVQIQAMAAEAGIKLEIKNVASGTEFSDLYKGGQFDAMLYQDPPAVPDAAFNLNLYMNSKSSQMTYAYNDPEMDAAILTAAGIDPGPDRADALKTVDELYFQDLPVLYLTETPYLQAVSKSVTNLAHYPYLGFNPVTATVVE